MELGPVRGGLTTPLRLWFTLLQKTFTVINERGLPAEDVLLPSSEEVTRYSKDGTIMWLGDQSCHNLMYLGDRNEPQAPRFTGRAPHASPDEGYSPDARESRIISAREQMLQNLSHTHD